MRTSSTLRPQGVCFACGADIELLGRYGNGRARWAHKRVGRGLGHFAEPRKPQASESHRGVFCSVHGEQLRPAAYVKDEYGRWGYVCWHCAMDEWEKLR